MSNNIYDLYNKYYSEIYPALAQDRVFQYLFKSVQAGDKTIVQRNQILHKVIDEEWICMIENSMQSIFNIVDNAIPNQKDSNYEYRFMYYLVRKVINFVEKRSEIIYTDTADDVQSMLGFESKVKDKYESLEYKIELKLTNHQPPVSNDNENREIFMRLDRISRMLDVLDTCPFVKAMEGCERVGDEIDQTELLTTDEDYIKCLALWNYMLSYDKLGYTIIQKDTANSFDETHVAQLYANVIASYITLRSVTGPDSRDVSSLLDEKTEIVAPKFIKRIEEQIVDNRDLDDVEVRRVFIEEVTKAQVEAEERLEVIKGVNKKLQAETDAMRARAEESEEIARVAVEEATKAKSFADNASTYVNAANAERDEAVEAKRQAEELRDKVVAEANARVESVVAEANAKVESTVAEANAKVESVVTETSRKVEATVNDAAQRVETATRLQKEAEDARMIAEQERDAAVIKMNESVAQAEEKVATMQAGLDARIEEIQAKANAAVQKTEEDATAYVQGALIKADGIISKTKEEAEARVAEITESSQRLVETTKAEAEAAVLKAQTEASEAIAAANARVEGTISAARAEAEAQMKEAKEAAEAQVAQIKADTALYVEQVTSEANTIKLNAEEKVKRTLDETKARVESEISKANETIRFTKEKATREIEEIQKDCNDRVAQATAKAGEALSLQRAAEEEAQRALAELEDIKDKMKKLETRCEIDVASAQKFAESAAAMAREQAESAIAKAQKKADELVEEASKNAHDSILAALEKQRIAETARISYEKEVAITMAEAKEMHERAVRLSDDARTQMAEAKSLKAEATAAIKSADKAVDVANKNAADAVAVAKKADARYQKEKASREKVEKKLRSSSFSKFFGTKPNQDVDNALYEIGATRRLDYDDDEE